MSFAEIKEAVAGVSPSERFELRDLIDTLKDEETPEELAAIDEALASKEPLIPAEQVWAELRDNYCGDK